MAPLTPHWQQPSHPSIQQVIINNDEFTSKSLSKVALPPFAVYAKMTFPPCTVAEEPTYATVQMDKNRHLNLNSDLLYINHSCEPSLIFDMASMNILAGPKGLRPGDELTFFYPSTEWTMAQPFTCLCKHPSCRGTISGAKDMPPAQLQGTWLNPHIRELLEPQQQQEANDTTVRIAPEDVTLENLQHRVHDAEKTLEAARLALHAYVAKSRSGKTNGVVAKRDVGPAAASETAGLNRRGATSRELSGEMGGDTV
ncbi:hypothetical protein E4U43_004406 [Claviceps pusilla]|uniref:Post-SET domain-containing protein n=1 Tax=Claviceps pusilla TaxID=123648 RepID=A0A9P7NF27_9HYPO|nr:hypothetical protein E4U43_004406 [Claviceps pusilla]